MQVGCRGVVDGWEVGEDGLDIQMRLGLWVSLFWVFSWSFLWHESDGEEDRGIRKDHGAHDEDGRESLQRAPCRLHPPRPASHPY